MHQCNTKGAVKNGIGNLTRLESWFWGFRFPDNCLHPGLLDVHTISIRQHNTISSLSHIHERDIGCCVKYPGQTPSEFVRAMMPGHP